MNEIYLLSFNCSELIEPYKVNETNVIVGKNEIEIPKPKYFDIDEVLPYYFSLFKGTISNIAIHKLTQP